MTNEMKQKYNEMVKRFHKGCDYMDNPNVAEETKLEWWPQFDKLMADMNMIAEEFKLTEEEMLNGFKN